LSAGLSAGLSAMAFFPEPLKVLLNFVENYCKLTKA